MAEDNNEAFPLGKENYKFMIIGMVLIIIGFFLMAGGGAESLEEFNYDEIFSERRITVAPLTILLGLGVVLYGIMKKPKEESSKD